MVSSLYANIPADNYKIKIEYPVSGTQLLDKTTQDTDSYGKSYPSGITRAMFGVGTSMRRRFPVL